MFPSYGSLRDTICALCEPEIATKIKPVWGVDDECEMNSAWRDCGVENLWIMLGTCLSRSAGGGKAVLTGLLLGNISGARSQSIPLALRESLKMRRGFGRLLRPPRFQRLRLSKRASSREIDTREIVRFLRKSPSDQEFDGPCQFKHKYPHQCIVQAVWYSE